MNQEHIIQDYAQLRHSQRILMFICGCSIVTCLGLCFFVLNKSDRVIIVPPNVSKSFWVDSNKVSSEYLEEMGLFLAHQLLDITPASFSYQRDIVMRYIHPSAHNFLHKKFIQDESKYRKLNLSTSFKPLEVKVGNLQINLKGQLISYVGQKRVQQDTEEYVMQFDYAHGRLLLKKFFMKGEEND
jgi:conjugal transfer pilus assembly protein TraE